MGAKRHFRKPDHTHFMRKNNFIFFSRAFHFTLTLRLYSLSGFLHFFAGLSSGKCAKCTLNHYFYYFISVWRQQTDVKQLKYISITVCVCTYMLTSRVHCMLLLNFFSICFKLTAKECNAVLFLNTRCSHMCLCVCFVYWII